MPETTTPERRTEELEALVNMANELLQLDDYDRMLDAVVRPQDG